MMTTTATTTPTDILATLQAAWRTPSLPAVDVADDSDEADAEPAIVAYCGPHNDPTQWEFKPDPYQRDGWRTANCKHCGSFIGHQPPQEKKRKRRQSSDARRG